MTPEGGPRLPPCPGRRVVYLGDVNGCLHAVAPSGSGGADVNLISGAFLCAPTQYAPSTQVTFASTAATFSPVSSANVNTGSFPAPPSGSVVIFSTFVAEASPVADVVGFGLCAHGTTTPMVGNSVITKLAVTGQAQPVATQFLVGGLTAGSAYTFDLMQAVASGGTVTTVAYANTSTAPTLGALHDRGTRGHDRDGGLICPSRCPPPPSPGQRARTSRRPNCAPTRPTSRGCSPSAHCWWQASSPPPRPSPKTPSSPVELDTEYCDNWNGHSITSADYNAQFAGWYLAEGAAFVTGTAQTGVVIGGMRDHPGLGDQLRLRRPGGP